MTEHNKKVKWYKTSQFFAGYLVAAWTFLQFVDWILNRNNISPNWVDLLLWVFIGIIPSLLIYLYHRERIHEGKIKLREKILVPLNVLLLTIAIYFGFGNSDLGATTKQVTYENGLGQLETKTFTKEEFRVGIPIFSFDQLNENDSINRWLRYGIGKIVYQDLLQNKNITPEFNFYTSTTTKIREASLFYDKYVDGSYSKTENTYTIAVNIRKANNAKVLANNTFTGENLLTLLDDISVFIASSVDQNKKNSLEYIDLPINEFMSNSLPALEAFTDENYDKAYTEDPYFALAYLEEAKLNRKYNRGKLETQDIINKASKYVSRLPLQKQLEVLIEKNLAYGEFEEAEKQVKLQLEVDPHNIFFNNILFSIFGETKNLEDYFKVSEELFKYNPSNVSGNNLAVAALVAGYEKQLIDALNAFEIINPEIKSLKIEPLIFDGKIKEAKAIYEEFKISHSYNTNRNKIYDSIFNYLDDKPIDIEDLIPFTGKYRSNINEQTSEYWIENERLIEYIQNQTMRTYVPAGEDAFGGGFLQAVVFYAKLVKDDNGKIIGIIKSDANWNNTFVRLFWKTDESILDAEEAFNNDNLLEAEQLYEKAIANNPDHAYLKNILKHIQYKKNTDSIVRNDQFQLHSGVYGPRKFWFEEGKFYYKRKGEDSNLPKVELLPLSDSLYMDLTRLGTLMSFNKTNETILSKSYNFNIDDFEWEQLKLGKNTFEKIK